MDHVASVGQFGSDAILTILNLSIDKHGIYLNLFRSSLISFSKVFYRLAYF